MSVFSYSSILIQILGEIGKIKRFITKDDWSAKMRLRKKKKFNVARFSTFLDAKEQKVLDELKLVEEEGKGAAGNDAMEEKWGAEIGGKRWLTVIRHRKNLWAVEDQFAQAVTNL